MKKSQLITLFTIVGVVAVAIVITIMLQSWQSGSGETKPNSPAASAAVSPSASSSSSGEKTTEVGGVEYKTGKDLSWPSEQIGDIERPASGRLTAVTTAKENNTITLTLEGVDAGQINEYAKRLGQVYQDHTVTDNNGYGITFKGTKENQSVDFLYDAASKTMIMKVTLQKK